LVTGGFVSATGNITGGNVNTGAVSLSGNIISALNVTGNITGANVDTPGRISATGNLVGGNLQAAGLSLSGNVVSALNVTGNIAGGNVNTPGAVSATGNVSGGNVNVTTGMLTLASFAADPGGVPPGSIYYNTSLGRIRGLQASGWTSL
jgi:hypothetical protein